jgi:hypothetical protein
VIQGEYMPDDDVTSKFALLMAVTCVRNTVIEDYHANGQLSDADMMAFNKMDVDMSPMIEEIVDDVNKAPGSFHWDEDVKKLTCIPE